MVKLPENPPPKQAATSIYESAPFFFPYRTRGVGMSVLKPFSQDFGGFGRQNSHGFRTPEYTIFRPPNTFRIVVLGDAVTWGAGVAMEDAFPFQLSERLNKNCQAFKTEVIALGVNGHKLKENFIQLLAHGEALDPDLVVFQFSPGHVDFYEYFSIFALHGVKDPFDKYVQKEQEVMQEGSLDYRILTDTLAEIRKWSDRKSTRVCFLVFPFIDVNRNGNNFGGYDPVRMPGYSFTHAAATDKIKASGFPTLNLIDTFKASPGQYLAVSPNDANPNTTAHRLAANALYSFLINNRLAGCEGFQPKPGDPRWKSEEALRAEAAARWKNYNSSFAEQVSFFEKIKELHPHDPWVIAELAGIYFNLRRFSDSFRLYDLLNQMKLEIAAPWYHMALTRGIRRIPLLEETIQKVPDHRQAMDFLATLYFSNEQRDRGCALIERLRSIASFQEQYERANSLFQENKCVAFQAPEGPAAPQIK